MHVRTGSRPLLAALAFLVIGVIGGTASAQTTDFATCPTTLPACSSSTSSCCTMNPSATATAKPIVIPMDRCHQMVATSGSEGPPGAGAPRNPDGSVNWDNAWCVRDPAVGADDGMFKVYGLVYRLMQQGIPVYWVVNPTKDPVALNQYTAQQEHLATDIDAWILSPLGNVPAPNAALTDCGLCPIKRLDQTTLAPVWTYPKREFPIRGGAFVIAPADRAKFDAFWNRTGAYAGLRYSFKTAGIDLYEVDTNGRFAFQDHQAGTVTDSLLPIAATINYAAQRIARIGSISAVATSWLDKAGLDDPATNASCVSGAFVPSDAVYCNVTNQQVQAGGLITGGFGWTWIDKWSDNSPCADFAERTMFDKIRDFMTAVPGVRTAGNVFAMESAVEVSERCAGRQLMGSTSGSVGLKAENSAINETASRPYIIRFPNNLFVQWGDVPIDFQSGAVTGWHYAGAGVGGYSPALSAAGSTLKRLVTLEGSATGSNPICSKHKATNSCDVFTTPSNTNGDITDMAAYARHENVGINGLIFYTGGNQIQNNTGHLRIVLNSLIATPLATVGQNGAVTEVSRSSPIPAVIANQQAIVQGTFERVLPAPSIPVLAASSDAAAFRFPYVKGHLRAVAATNISTSSTQFKDQTPIFDAANGIPSATYSGCVPAFGGTCRTVFTTTTKTFRPARVLLQQSNLSTLGPLMGSTLDDTARGLLIQRVLAGHEQTPGNFVPRLGGVDRSTVAVIPASNVAGGARPTIAYFGAADGMLHAVCASVQGVCTSLGRELWAYIPRTLLPQLRFNTATIQGSPRVMDMFGDFDQDGRKEFRTILLFQTGSGDATSTERVPAVYALDVTDPQNPIVLWEHSMSSVTTRATHELGQGLIVAAGRVRIGGAERLLAFAQGANLGTDTAGSVTVAIDIETGAQVWKHGYTYPAPRTATNPVVPGTGVPGGAVAVDKQQNGYVTDVVFGTLYGDLWQLDAATGLSRHGGTGAGNPLLRFTNDFHPIGSPPAVFSDAGIQYAVIATGGYTDAHNSSWTGPTTVQYAAAVSLNTPATSAPLTQGSGSPYVRFLYSFPAGERAYAQALVVGNEIFITTDNGDVNSASYGTSGNNTGKAYRLTTSGGSSGTAVVLAGGATSVANVGTAMYTGSGNASQRLGTNAASTSGASVDGMQTAGGMRKLWLRTL